MLAHKRRYLAAGVLGSAASVISVPSALFVGASGAVCGLLGAAGGNVLMNRAVHETPVAALCRVCLIALIQVWVRVTGALQSAIGTAPTLDYGANAVGCFMDSVVFLAMFEYQGISASARLQSPASGGLDRGSAHTICAGV